MKSRLAQALFTYCLTPQSTTGVSPGELLLGCRLRSRLKPHTAERVEKNQMKQKEQHDLRSRERKLEVGENVFVRNYHHGNRWIPGTVEQKNGPVSFRVKLTDGRDRRCHQDQLCKRSVEVSQDLCSEPELVTSTPVISVPSTTPTDSSTTTTEPISQESKPPDPTSIPTTDGTVVDPIPQEKTYPKRDHAPVTRYEPT